MVNRRVQTTIGELYIETVGSGPPAMLWHSLFVDSHQWDRVRARLSQHRTLLMVDGPGHGRSGPPPMKFSLEDCAAAAMQVLDALGIGRVDWVGNAWGGHVGIVLGAIEPQRIKSIVAGAAPLHPLRPSQRMQINALVTIYRLFGPTRLVRNAVEAALLSYDVRRNDVQAVRLVRDAFVAAEKTGMYRAMRDVMLHRPDITDSFRALRVPILLIAGEQDEFWTPDDAMDAARQNRAAVASTIDRSSHLAALEAADLFVQRTLEFWNSNNVSTTSNGFAIGQPVPESLVQAVKHCPKPNDEAGRQ